MSDFQAPIGAEVVESSTPSNDQGDNTNNNGSTTPVELNDDTPVRWVGEKEPIRYGDLSKRLQAAETRKNQAIAKREADLARKQKEWEAATAAKESEFKQMAAALLMQRGGQGEDPYAGLAQKPFIDGATFAQYIKELQENGLGGVNNQLSQTSQVINALHQAYMGLQREVAALKGTHTNQSFDNKINRWLSEGGYPAEYADWMKETYLAYEGEGLDDEFPEIFAKRVASVTQSIHGQQKAKVDANKRRPFNFPGKGGNGTPGKSIGLKGNESPRETADFLWEALQASGGDET